MSSTQETKPSYQALTPKSETGRRFTEWYSHGWDFIEKTASGWTTVDFYPLSPREIWDKHQDPATIIGLRFDKTTRVLTLDLDRDSAYHPANDPAAIEKIKAAMEEIGLCRHVLTQSSTSGGLHLIYPLSAEVPTFKAACLLKTTLEGAGLEIKKGQLESFPNLKRYSKNGKPSLYNGIRLPLQPGSGSYLLDDDLNTVSDRVEDFLDQMDWAAAGQNGEIFTSLLDSTYENYKARPRWREDNLSRRADQWKRSLETILAGGWTGHGQTNDLIIKFVTYAVVFLKLQGQELRERVKQQVINAPGYQQYCRHQHEIDKRIEEICYYTERNLYYLPYRNHPERGETFNETYRCQGEEKPASDSRREDTRHRLQETVAYLEARGLLPELVAARRQAIQTTAKELFDKAFSITTLGHRDNLPLWHPKYRVGEIREPQPPATPERESENDSESAPERDLYRIQPTPAPVLSAPAPETLAPSNLVSFPPLYEVFEAQPEDTNSKIFNTTTPSSPLPTDTPLPAAPEKFGDDDGTLERTRPSDPSLEESATEGKPSPDTPEPRIEVKPMSAEEYRTRKAHLDANKQAFLNYGLPIPASLLALDAELERYAPAPEPERPMMTDASGEDDRETTRPPEVVSEPAPERVLESAIAALSFPFSAENDRPEPPRPDEGAEPQPITRKMLFQKCEDYGVTVNPTVRKQIFAHPVEVVSDALEALRERKREGLISNPAGFLVKAIQERWRPSGTNHHAGSPPAAITEEFLTWYARAIAAGVVEDLPVEWLSTYMNREPMVRVKRSLGSAPYTLMRWTEARETLGDF